MVHVRGLTGNQGTREEGKGAGAEEVLTVEYVVWEELGGLVQYLDRLLPASDPVSGNPPLGACSPHPR